MQTDSKDLHVQKKGGDVYTTEIKQPGCFASRNPLSVIYIDMLQLTIHTLVGKRIQFKNTFL